MNILSLIANNPALTEALRELLEKKFKLDYNNLPVGVDNARLGEIVAARLEGLKLINEAFNEISGYKQEEEKEVGANPAR